MFHLLQLKPTNYWHLNWKLLSQCSWHLIETLVFFGPRLFWNCESWNINLMKDGMYLKPIHIHWWYFGELYLSNILTAISIVWFWWCFRSGDGENCLISNWQFLGPSQIIIHVHFIYSDPGKKFLHQLMLYLYISLV